MLSKNVRNIYENYLFNTKTTFDNFIFSFFFGIVLFFFFLLLRSMFPGFYKFRTKRHKEKEKSLIKNFSLITEEDLLPKIGIEAVLFLKITKTLIFIFLSSSIFIFFIFVFHVLFVSPEIGSFFLGVLAKNEISQKEKAIIVVLMTYFLTFSVVFFIENINKQNLILNLSRYEDPIVMNREEVIQEKFNFYTKGMDLLKVFQKTEKTILVQGLDSRFTKKKLQIYFEYLKVGQVESTCILEERKKIFQLINTRDWKIIKLERAVYFFLKNIKKQINCKKRYVSNIIDPNNIIPEERKRECFRKIIDKTFCKEIRQKTKENEDEIIYYIKTILTLQENISLMIGEDSFCLNCGQTILLDNILPEKHLFCSSREEISTPSDELTFRQKLFKQGVFLKYLNTWKNLTTRTKSGFVTFSSSIDAQTVKDFLFKGKGVPETSNAPLQTDVLWHRTSKTRLEKNFRESLSVSFTIVFLFLFTMFVFFFISVFFELFQQKIEQLKGGSDEQKIKARLFSFLLTIFIPFLYNCFLLSAPIILNWIVLIKCLVDQQKIEETTTKHYSFFLFFQTFFILLLDMATPDSFKSLIKTAGIDVFIKEIKKAFDTKGTFFFNILIQRTFYKVPILLLKISGLSIYIIESSLGYTTPRMKIINSTMFIDYISIYPFDIINNFHILFVYTTTIPCINFIGLLYFFFTYSAFKYKFINYEVTKRETYGKLLNAIVPHILYSVFLFHFVSVINLVNDFGWASILFLIPVIVWSLIYIPKIVEKIKLRKKFILLPKDIQLLITDFVDEERIRLNHNLKEHKKWKGENPMADAVLFDGSILCLRCIENNKNFFQRHAEEEVEKNNPYTNPKIPDAVRFYFIFPRELFEIISDIIDCKLK